MKFSPRDKSAWARVSPYLDQALDLEPHERAAWLKTLESTEPEIAASVRDLLNQHAALNARGFLAGSLLPATRLDDFIPALEQMVHQRIGIESGDWLQVAGIARPLTALMGLHEGTVLGAYRLLREIGQGGMSCVWLAERIDGALKREVALKLPFEGPRRAQIAERFQRERDILATLTHPNIARLYDAGISASGQAYLAMEYVPGLTLKQYCDTERLPVRERLRMFLQVLSAVEFAHTHLVLHRDLKPSNILVAHDGRVVLLDFGVAKILTPEADPAAPLTEMMARLLTPDYASPEQIAGKALSTISDIYSLGIVLYELLCGARPFNSEKGSRRDLEDAVLHKDPPRLIQAALTDEVAAARGTTPPRLRRALKGDLETIVLKALKKAPADRYHSAGALAQDIRHYLEDLPVSARPDSTGYRARRFIARYKLQVTAATVTLLAIMGGGATAAWQARMAQAQARAAAKERDSAVALASRNAAMSDFMSMLISEAALSNNGVTVSELLARSEQLAMADSGESNEDRAAILGLIGNLLFSRSGDAGQSMKVYDRAFALLRHSQDSRLRSQLVCDHATTLANADAGQFDAATRAIHHELENPELEPAAASNCLVSLSRISVLVRDAPAALRYATQALEQFHRAIRQPLTDEGTILADIAEGYALNGRSLQADRYYEKALQKYSQAGREHTWAANIILNNWSQVSVNAGVPKRALELTDRALSFIKDNDPNAHPSPVMVFNRGRTLEDIGRYAEAQGAYELGLHETRELKFAGLDVFFLMGLASIAEQQGDRTAARHYLDEASALISPSWPANHQARMRRLMLEGKLALVDGKPEQARTKFEQVLAASAAIQTKTRATLGKAEALILADDAAGAVVESQAALNMATALQGGVPYSNNTGLAWLMLGRALQARGDLAQARKAYEAAVTNLANTVDADHPELLRARQLLDSTADAPRQRS